MGRIARCIAVSFLLLCFQNGGFGQTCSEPFDVGYRIVELREGRKAAIWYPGAEAGQSLAYGREGEIKGVYLPDGKAADCPGRPLLVFSHGLGGCGTQSLFLTEELARAGYVVIAPDHRDAVCSVDGGQPPSFENPSESLLEPDTWTPATYADRGEDIRLAIDLVLADAALKAVVDPARIGVVGHSLGGYSALGVAGAWEEWRDTRVRALLLLSPYLLPYQSKSTLGQVRLPLMYQGAEGDFGITPSLQGPRGAYRTAATPRYFVKLRGGSHFEWTNLICFEDPTLEECLATSANGRLINRYSRAFLDQYLNDGPSAPLLKGDPALSDYQRTVPLVSLSAASYDAAVGASPESIVSAFGDGLAEGSAAADRLPLPTSLAGLRIIVTDAGLTQHVAGLFYAGPGQVNYLAPAAAAQGTATIQAYLNLSLIAEGSLEIGKAAPAVFSADASGRGAAAGTYTRVLTDGSRQTGLLFDPQTGQTAAVSIGAPGDELYLSLFGTGLRGGSGLTATVGGQGVAVSGPVAHPDFEGLDQVNLGPIPPALAGQGAVDIVLSLDGQAANTTQAAFR